MQSYCCIIIRSRTLSNMSLPDCLSSVAEFGIHISTTVNTGDNNVYSILFNALV